MEPVIRDPLSIAVEMVCKALQDWEFQITFGTSTNRAYNHLFATKAYF